VIAFVTLRLRPCGLARRQPRSGTLAPLQARSGALAPLQAR